jgi:hypothetical protein
MLIPKYRTRIQLQQEYLKYVDDMNLRKGPLVTEEKRLKTRVAIEKRDFAERSTLMAAPILFQTMVQRTAKCPFNYSTEFISKMHDKAMAEKCDDSIYTCDASTSEKESIMACNGEVEKNATFFGLTPTRFNAQDGYADFLSSITDTKFVFRDGLLQKTEDFIHSATKNAQIVYVFFTPSAGLVTLLIISADFSVSEAEVKASATVNHYGIVEGEALRNYCLVSLLLLVNIVIMYFDVFFTVANLRLKGEFNVLRLMMPLVDIFSGFLIVVYTIRNVSDKLSSAGTIASVLNRLEGIYIGGR